MAIDWASTFGPTNGQGAPPPGVAAPQAQSQYPLTPSAGGGIGGTASANTTWNQAYGAYNSAATPDYLDLQAQRNSLLNQGGLDQANTGLNQEALNLRYASDLGDAQTNQGQNAIALAAAQRQPGVLDQLSGIQQGIFSNQRQGYANQAGIDKRSLQANATANGAMITTGTRQGYKDIYGNLINQLQGVDLQNQQFDVNNTENKAQAQDRIATLGLEANNLGLKPDQLASMLKNGLAEAGLQGDQAYNQLLDGLRSNDINAMKLKATILQNAQNYTNTAQGGLAGFPAPKIGF